MKCANLRLVLILMTLAFGAGCTTLKTKVPLAKVQSPQVVKHETLRWDILKTYPAAENLDTQDASKRPPNIQRANDGSVSIMGGLTSGAQYGLSERVQLGVVLGSFDGFEGKWLLLETPTDNQDSRHLVSVFGGFLNSSTSNSGNQKGEFGPGGYPWKGSTLSQSRMLGVSYGFENSKGTFYFGGAYSHFDSKLKIEQEANLDNTSPAATYESIDSGYSKTASIGFESQTGIFGLPQLQMSLALSLSELTWGTYKKTNSQIEWSLSRNFGDLYTQPNTPELFPKESWRPIDFGAVLSSYAFGFGSGQALQGNWKRTGFNFFLADVAGMGFLVSGLTGFNRQDGSVAFGAVILIASRVWQVFDAVQEARRSTPTPPMNERTHPSSESP